MPKFTAKPSPTITAPNVCRPTEAPAPVFQRLSPTVRPPAPVPITATPEEVALFERFKAFEAQRLAPVRVEHIVNVPPPPPSAKTERLHQLFRGMETDSGPRIRSARAFKEIKDDALWVDSFSSFKACCQDRLMPLRWVAEMLDSIPVFEALPPAARAMVRTSDELTELARFKKTDRVLILNKAAARNLTDNGQFATRIQDAARALGLKPEGTR